MLWDSVSLLVLFIWCGAALSQVFETRRGAFVFEGGGVSVFADCTGIGLISIGLVFLYEVELVGMF